MKTYFTEEDKYIRAKKKVDNIKGFYANLLAYCLVIPFLFFINYMTSPSYWWFLWPMMGWGLGLGFHAFGVFGNNLILGKDWEQRKIDEIMNEDKNRNI